MRAFTLRLLTGVVASVFGLALTDGSMAQQAPCGVEPATPPTPMMIKIFNDNDGQYIFPVLTMGHTADDIWLRAIFKTPAANNAKCLYPRNKSFRIYINPTKGIPPGGSVILSLPLYTQMVPIVSPNALNQYINWWFGGTVMLYSNAKAETPPSLAEAYALSKQNPVTPIVPCESTVPPGKKPCSFVPKCTGCELPLTLYGDAAELPKNHPNQLIEFTLGARQALPVKNPATDPENALDVRNVDFDISYVNLAALPAALGPVDNDQVGYVGSTKTINEFKTAITTFRNDVRALYQIPTNVTADWPRFTYKGVAIDKLAAPLEIFPRLKDKTPPPDLEAAPAWPTKLWAPIEAIRTNWKKWAGPAVPENAGDCKATSSGTAFCDAIIKIKALFIANYKKYKTLFPPTGTTCTGTPVTLTDDLLISHVYGWTSFVEAVEDKKGCAPTANLLENTSTFYSANNYTEYAKVKKLFDELHYEKLVDQKYPFNLWVRFIHNAKYVGAPNTYAYSVDDAVGNVQADALGFIIDVGSTKNLENKLPAIPPINVNIGGTNQGVSFTDYRLCQDLPSRNRKVNPLFLSFIVNANDPASCPIFLLDSKGQKYTFTITQKPPFNPALPAPPKPPWNTEIAGRIGCLGNSNILPPSQYKQSSRTWCCNYSSKNGVVAYSIPEPHSAHSALTHFAVTPPPEASTTSDYIPCDHGQPIRPTR